MTKAQLKDALEAYAEAKNDHDVDRLIELRSDDCVDDQVSTGIRLEGKEALRAFFARFFVSIPDYYGEFDGAAYGDDTSVVWGRWGGTLGDDLMGIPVEPGRRLEVPTTFVCSFREGLLTSDVQYFDAATLAEQAGLSLDLVRGGTAKSVDRDAAAKLVDNFKRLWGTKNPEIVKEIVAPDATAHWSGLPRFRGSDYPAQMRRLMKELMPDIRSEVTGHASEGDYVFISWRARATVAGEELEWDGMDRFRLRGGLADEVYAIFDTGPMRDAMEQAGREPRELLRGGGAAVVTEGA